ncbi:serpin-ZX [Artemisia annua]|uniref:Serpin-ZX n=1 Tax=Artemisia annua TaxID=35608 RepID=A0A2U1PAD8_ARTAN|nr:serpin-ZX [Artemisia annua]
MAEGRGLKRTVYGDKPCIQSEKKQKKITPAATIAANTTTVVTKTLLADARNGFKKGNFVCSPLSLDIVLGMLTVGAEGETLKQLLGFLRHRSIDQFLSQSPSSKLLAQSLSKRDSGLEFSLVNSVWVEETDGPVLSSYQKVLQNVYKTEAKYMDFKDRVKLNEAVKEINSWVKKETKGLIPTMIKTDDFKGNEILVLANALYFKGTWCKQFEAQRTWTYDFYLMNGRKVSVPFMTLDKQRFQYGSFKGYTMIKLPYESNDGSNHFSMYIFLPKRIDGLRDLIKLFHADDTLFYGDFDLEPKILRKLWIPKFKISSTFEPADVMKQMGLTLPFDEMNREFRGIVPDGDFIYVSKILQKSVIEVDERGTVAASCTMMMVGRGGCPPEINFVADHPFMFMIREDTSKAVFFVGAVLNPGVN